MKCVKCGRAVEKTYDHMGNSTGRRSHIDSHYNVVEGMCALKRDLARQYTRTIFSNLWSLIKLPFEPF